MVGRGCLGRPWLFRDLAAAFAGEEVATLPSLGEVCAMMRRHAELLAQHMGEERGCKEFRKHVSWYLKGFRAGGELRRNLGLVDTLAALDRLLDELDPTEPFPASELGAPRGRQGSATQAGRAPGGLAGGLRRCRLRRRRRPGRGLRRLIRPRWREPTHGARNPPKIGDGSRGMWLSGASAGTAIRGTRRVFLPRNSKGSALWHIATSGKPMPAASPVPP